MGEESLPGHIKNLNEEQQLALKELETKFEAWWAENRDRFVNEDSPKENVQEQPPSVDVSPPAEQKKKKKKKKKKAEDVQLIDKSKEFYDFVAPGHNGELARHYLRFLRARDWRINVAFQLLVDCTVWRKEFQNIGVINIPESSIQKELSSGKCFVHGVDRDGRPVAYIRVKLHKKSEVDHEEVQRYCVWVFETVAAICKPPSESSTIIFDMRGFSMENMDYNYVKFLLSVFEKRYPETLGYALIVHSPWIFNACWQVIKPWMHPNTVRKVVFCNQAELLKYVDEDNLIEDLGGRSKFQYEYPPKNSTPE